MNGIKFWTMPGLAGSDSGHWQTIWEQQNPEEFERVGQDNWDWPVMEKWVQRLHERLLDGTSPVVLIAHSLGCITLAHWSSRYTSDRVAGAMLVAPADAEQSRRLSFVEGFTPVPTGRLPFPSVVVASADDIYMTIERSAYFAEKWGSNFISVGKQGHINASSGLGEWAFGKQVLAGLVSNLPEKSGNEAMR
jgi:predicted alpha/beta hydrolase family esterase